MLVFEYCECGCHGSSSERIGETTFWIGIDNHLYRGHGSCGVRVAECVSYSEAVAQATLLAKELLIKEEARLAEIRKQIGPPAKQKKLPTFRQELVAQFPGDENAALRRMIRDCNNSRNILKLSGAFTEDARIRLAIVAAAFDRG